MGIGTPVFAQNTPVTTIVNQAKATYSDSDQQALEADTNPLEIPHSALQVLAGVKVDATKIVDATTGLRAVSANLKAEDRLSYYFTVTNTGNTPNPIRIPAVVSLFNLEVLGQSVYRVTDQGNQIVILYDQNGDGKIALSNDQNGNGQWDAVAPNDRTKPDQGPEVWIYNSAIQDYVNSAGVTWSKATVFIPPNGSFQVVVTARVPNNLSPGAPLLVSLGNPPSLPDSNGDGIPEIDPLQLQNLPYQPGGVYPATDQDVYTVNRRNETEPENYSIFANGQREATSPNFEPLVFFGDVSAQVDLGLNILDPGKFTIGVSGSYSIDISNNGPGTVRRFLVSLKGFENVLGTNPQLILQSLKDSQGNNLNIAGVTVTQQSDGRWLIAGITFTPGQVLRFNVTGIVQPLAADVVFQVDAEVSSPKQPNGAFEFVDTVSSNNVDLDPVQLQVDLAVTLQPAAKFVTGQLGQYNITVTNNGPAAVNEFVLKFSDFQKVFSNLNLTAGTYTVSADGQLIGANGQVSGLPLRFVQILDRDGKTPLDLSSVVITIKGNGFAPDGSITISGFTFIPRQQVLLSLSGILNDVGTAGQQVKVEVSSPLSVLGTPLFKDTNLSNNQDQDQLVDPLGRLVNCSGALFDTTGFTAALFDTNDGGSSVTGLTTLPTPSSAEVIQLQQVLNVNLQNVNPFSIGSDGQYNFLFSQDQAKVGKQYVLVITPPANLQSSYGQRRILMTVTGVTTSDNGLVSNFSYTVKTLDELPVNLDNNNLTASVPGSGGSTGVNIGSAAQDYLNILSTSPDNGSTLICQTLSLRISKVANRVSASPGDIVIYRITVNNTPDIFQNEGWNPDSTVEL